MTRNQAMVSMTAFLILVFAIGTWGQEKRIKRSDLPAAVQKTADEQSKGATVGGYTKDTSSGQVEYEVEMIIDGHSKDVSIDPSGKILEVEEQVPVDKLPVEVREGLQKMAGKGKITKVESITKHAAIVAYEAQVRNGTKRSEVQVGPNGKPLDHEE
jgi:hypothetical protein